MLQLSILTRHRQFYCLFISVLVSFSPELCVYHLLFFSSLRRFSSVSVVLILKAWLSIFTPSLPILFPVFQLTPQLKRFFWKKKGLSCLHAVDSGISKWSLSLRLHLLLLRLHFSFPNLFMHVYHHNKEEMGG